MSFASATAPLDLVSTFKSYCLSYADHVRYAGVKIAPFHEEHLPIFSALTDDAKLRVLHAIEADVSIFEEIKNEGGDLRDSAKHLWRFLRASEYTPESDLFDKITDSDLIEVYSADEHGERQIFRNMRYLECVSMSVEQLYGMDWKVATSRDPEYEKAIFDAAMSIMSEEVTTTLKLNIPPHRVQELNSPRLYTWSITFKYLSPVRHKGRVTGVIVVNHTQIIGSLN